MIVRLFYTILAKAAKFSLSLGEEYSKVNLKLISYMKHNYLNFNSMSYAHLVQTKQLVKSSI